MNNKEQMMEAYEAPLVEVIEVQVEQGFAGSVVIGGSASDEDLSGDGNIGVEW